MNGQDFERLRNLIKERCLGEGDFPLPNFINLREISNDQNVLKILGNQLSLLLTGIAEFDRIVGIELVVNGFLQQVSMIALAMETGKSHSTVAIQGIVDPNSGIRSSNNIQVIDPRIPDGDRVLLIQDAISQGEIAEMVIPVLQDRNIQIVGFVSVVDRDEGGRDRVEQLGIRFRSLYTLDEILRENG